MSTAKFARILAERRRIIFGSLQIVGFHLFKPKIDWSGLVCRLNSVNILTFVQYVVCELITKPIISSYFEGRKKNKYKSGGRVRLHSKDQPQYFTNLRDRQ